MGHRLGRPQGHLDLGNNFRDVATLGFLPSYGILLLSQVLISTRRESSYRRIGLGHQKLSWSWGSEIFPLLALHQTAQIWVNMIANELRISPEVLDTNQSKFPQWESDYVRCISWTLAFHNSSRGLNLWFPVKNILFHRYSYVCFGWFPSTAQRRRNREVIVEVHSVSMCFV